MARNFSRKQEDLTSSSQLEAHLLYIKPIYRSSRKYIRTEGDCISAIWDSNGIQITCSIGNWIFYGPGNVQTWILRGLNKLLAIYSLRQEFTSFGQISKYNVRLCIKMCNQKDRVRNWIVLNFFATYLFIQINFSYLNNPQQYLAFNGSN